MNQNVFCQLKNPTFYPKTVELIVDWQQVESIADSDLQQFFCYARECLAGIFPCSNENSKTVVDEDSAECNMFSQGTVPLRLSKFVSLEIVARYLYDHWPLWIRLAHRTARFYDICIRLYKTDDGWFDKWFEKVRRLTTVVTAGFDAWFVKMLYDMHLSDMAEMGLRSCVERSVYWHDLAERLTLLEESRNKQNKS